MNNIINRMIQNKTKTGPIHPRTHHFGGGGSVTSVSSHAEVHSIIMTRIEILSEMCDRGFLIAVFNITSIEIIKTVVFKARTQKQVVHKMSHCF